MKITLLQTDIIWGQPEANLAHLDHLLEGVGECDLIVLPEMFTTGFDTNPETVADDEGLALKWMRNTVRQRNCALAGSVATKVGENYYNRMYFVSPDLLLASYDKHHLFTYGHEQEAFTPGHRRVVIPYRGARILLQVCYDLRFPSLAATVATTTWRSMSPTGRRADRRCGTRCSAPAPSRTKPMSWASTAWARMPMASMPADPSWWTSSERPSSRPKRAWRVS